MTISAQLNLVNTALATWSATEGGTAEIAQDPVHMFAILAAKPGKIRAATIFITETKRGQYEEAGFVDRTYKVVLSRGKGFTVDPGAGLTKDTASGKPLFDLLEEAREIIRALSFDTPDTEVTPDYKYLGVFRVESAIPLDAYEIEFSIGTQLPAVVIPVTV